MDCLGRVNNHVLKAVAIPADDISGVEFYLTVEGGFDHKAGVEFIGVGWRFLTLTERALKE